MTCLNVCAMCALEGAIPPFEHSTMLHRETVRLVTLVKHSLRIRVRQKYKSVWWEMCYSEDSH